MDFINMLFLRMQKKWNFFLVFVSHKLKWIVFSFLTVILIFCVVFFWMNQVNYVVLYHHLSDTDGGWVISKLQDMNVPYRLHHSSRQLLVPEDKIDELRFSLMKNKDVIKKNDGFELLDQEKFGVSQFHEHVNYHRGLEGELSRTLECIFPIQYARVHLVCKKDTDFFKDDQVPSASVVIAVFPDTKLNQEQIDAITLLISGSVPNLSADNIVVVNQFGNILNKYTLNYSRFFNDNKYKKINILEQSYCDSINRLLKPMYGSKNFVVHVRAKIKKNNDIIHNVKADNIEINGLSKKLSNKISDVCLNNKKNMISESMVKKIFLMKKLSNFFTKKNLINNFGCFYSTFKKNFINTDNYISCSNTDATHSINKGFIKSNIINDYNDDYFLDLKRSEVQHLDVTVLINYKKSDAGKYVSCSTQELQDLEKLIKLVIDFSDHRGDCINIINYRFISSHTNSNHNSFVIYNYLNVNYLFFLCIGVFFVFLMVFIYFKNIIIDNKKKNSLATVSSTNKNFKNSQHVDTDKLNCKKNNYINKDRLFIKRDILDKHPKIIEQVIRYWINKK
ncbi:Flagellar M-ring protein [Buchnera aphidicola (Cinara pseudotaxifoliae)]|uniref:Flagellar M-ring protein n=1 Tax=Buchnera aphidicola (Cinara pseudotaxifoliae) TaxID=655384 RepID=A0A451DG67_9GAMM|nr:flagellar basal-body MS-ring/collar protein FliF [Buchnera aphidicola]VFP85616.1 Flagellar M-ring protein [Buchnera aphidicola (Cinara pseudotaxifoliae)]